MLKRADWHDNDTVETMGSQMSGVCFTANPNEILRKGLSSSAILAFICSFATLFNVF